MYKQFNDMALTFLSRMEETFPNEPKIRSYKQQFIILKDIDPKKPVTMFISNMELFGENILSKNEYFFKQENIVKNAESISGKLGLIKYWDNLTETTKNSIWEYIQGLYILGMIIIGKNDDLQEVIKKTGFKGK